MPAGIFGHVHGAAFEVGKALVEHPHTKAVGFTGSYIGGRQLFDWANQRSKPIPVFAEMSSINPVFLLPGKLKESAAETATLYASSITLGVGQFCTNPGLIIGIEGAELKKFIHALGEEIVKTAPGTMLHMGIFKNYVERRGNALSQEAVDTVAVSEKDPHLNEAAPTLASTTGSVFKQSRLTPGSIWALFIGSTLPGRTGNAGGNKTFGRAAYCNSDGKRKRY